MTGDLALRCQCGALRGRLTERTARAGTPLTCHCRDCRAFQVAMGRDDPGAATGVDLLQVAPAGLHFTDGAEHLAALRLSPRGPFRFHAGCCGSPVATTLTRRAFPFASLMIDLFEEPARLGPIRVHANIAGASGQVTHKRMGRLVRRLLSAAAASYLRGEGRVSPFFDPATGAPIAIPAVIDKARKAEIYRAL